MITGTGATGNMVAGDYIGTDITGTVAIANDKMVWESTPSHRPTPSAARRPRARNVISGNADAGVEIDDANDNVVEGNFIGTDVTGTSALGNRPAISSPAVSCPGTPPATPSAGSPRRRAPA